MTIEKSVAQSGASGEEADAKLGYNQPSATIASCTVVGSDRVTAKRVRGDLNDRADSNAEE